MGAVIKQVTLTKSAVARTENQDVEQLRVLNNSPALLDGTSKPTIADAGAAPTQAQFNALLAALRTRGVIS